MLPLTALYEWVWEPSGLNKHRGLEQIHDIADSVIASKWQTIII